MPQKQSVKEKLQALHDELKSAAGKQDAPAKKSIRAAIADVTAAKAQVKAALRSEDAARKRQADHDIKRLEEIARNGKKALDHSGDKLRTHLHEMIASARSVLDDEKTDHHEHKAPQCKTAHEGTICNEGVCLHDHLVSHHVEISCAPVKGRRGLFDCVHEGHES